jgi:hypothetical protein
MPLSVEAVVWAASVFDLLLVTLVLLFALAAVTPAQTNIATASMIALTILALATKETAVVAPVLAALTVYVVAGKADRYWPLAISAAAAAAYAVARLAATGDDSEMFQPFTGYVIKEMVGRPFAALALPLHESVIAASPWLAVAPLVAAPVLVTCAVSTWRAQPAAARRSLAAAVWILVSVAPLLTMMFVGPDLLGAPPRRRVERVASSGARVCVERCGARACVVLSRDPRPSRALDDSGPDA